MQTLTSIVGYTTDHEIAHRLHDLEHADAVHYITLNPQDTLRHRLRAVTDRGDEVAIALPRSDQLTNGAVLLLEAHRAIVVRMQAPQWLALQARDVSAALELGYFAGNMHWKVQFAGDTIRIALEGPQQRYLERLEHILMSGKARQIDV